MTMMTNGIIGQQGISTLDVLWAFYMSQPPKVKKAFRDRMESEEKHKAMRASSFQQWKTDLKAIRSLKANWDEEGAPSISRDAISHVDKFIPSLDAVVSNQLRLYPTHLGAVMIKLETGNGRIKCEIGDRQMSYFVKRTGKLTEHHSFEDINTETLASLKLNLESIA